LVKISRITAHTNGPMKWLMLISALRVEANMHKTPSSRLASG
jgi:hypothetical protein